MNITKLCRNVVIVAIVCIPFSAFAQNDQELQRAQFKLRQVNAAKAQVEQQLNSLKQEFESYKSKMSKKVAVLEERNSKLRGNLGSWKADAATLSGQLKKSETQLDRQIKKGQLLKTILEKQVYNYQVCEKSNESLVNASNELIKKYNDKGLAQVMSEREPLTGIAKVQVENLVQEYSHRVEDNNLKKIDHRLKKIDLPKKNGDSRENDRTNSNGKPDKREVAAKSVDSASD